VNVLPLVKAEVSCFYEKCTTIIKIVTAYALSTGVNSRAAHGIFHKVCFAIFAFIPYLIGSQLAAEWDLKKLLIL